ncbi:16S rRNA (cytosine1402-N4)-methyltransferase [Verrucomicrobium sp. GAS474]|uniref:16S rRNA (cytosine(1402)-N(4))-methyltransferase RsmH n=1 Tax=Verrucomicrobium sp. GAS474 TaxID=1882831 RepID=UPI00087CBAEB|nr:16S rRNA (cytosine(1402)-N(4))-methyltransferase RsmH [Verrucomicrobium sp. GAS474]SDU28909.1 16S rRNA (cytosine1402-N4)-methyltransferase [Verrucomicrobium sp. GAS474]
MAAFSHTSVLLGGLLEWAKPAKGERWIDATFGRGGHTTALLERGCSVLALDRDAEAIAAAAELEAVWSHPDNRLCAMRSDFSEIALRCAEMGWNDGQGVDGVLFDLGVSSPQFDDPQRGFSFRYEAPLDMRMDQRQELTAGKIVNEWEEEALADCFYHLGGERQSYRIAKAIVRRRESRPIGTTTDLADVVSAAAPRRRGEKIHPATQIFQALRMAVNREVEVLEAALPAATALLRPGGCLAVIAFHSGEDRIVKNFMRDRARRTLETPDFAPVAANPDFCFDRVERVLPDDGEIEANPRARSARLRLAWKKE